MTVGLFAKDAANRLLHPQVPNQLKWGNSLARPQTLDRRLKFSVGAVTNLLRPASENLICHEKYHKMIS